MKDFILIYITCDSIGQAKTIGTKLLEKRLCGCINIYPGVMATYWWPPKKNQLETSEETILLVKTIKSKFSAIEKEIYNMKIFETPTIIGIPTEKINKDYYDWIKGEIK